MVPGLTDNKDRAIELLEAIARGVGELDRSMGQQRSVPRVGGSVRTILPGSYVVRETDDLDEANPDGTVDIEPGREVTIVEHETDEGAIVTAVGANDVQDVVYWLEVDRTYAVGGRTNSPLGSINSPFSFVDVLGGVIPVTSHVAYKAFMPASASASASLAGRLHVEEVPTR